MKKKFLSGLDENRIFIGYFEFCVNISLLFGKHFLFTHKLSNKISLRGVGLSIHFGLYGITSCRAIGKVCSSSGITRLTVDIIESIQFFKIIDKCQINYKIHLKLIQCRLLMN